MEIFKAIASIHQLHTHIDLDEREQVLPFHFFYQEGNIYVNGVHPQYKDVIYGKLIEVQDTSIEDVMKALDRRTFSFNQTNLNLNYDVQYLPSGRALYLPYRMCAEDKSYPITSFEQRNNPGGASWVLDPLIDKLKEVPALPGRVFVLINQGTASSASINAYTMKHKLQATLVGSTTQSSPNKPGEVKMFKLPESGLNISYSTRKFHLVEEETDSLYPDIPVDLTITDYEEDVDRVVQTVLLLNP